MAKQFSKEQVLKSTKQYAVHHTDVSRERSKVQLYSVNRYHKEKWGMKSTLGWYGAYNYFMDVDGTITKFREPGEETIANKGHNCDVLSRCDTISMCIAGNFNQELPNDKQIKSFKKWIAEQKLKYKDLGWTFHRLIQKNRTCPGLLYTKTYHKTRILGEGVPKVKGEDAKKREQIAQLMSIVDQLRALLRIFRRRK